MNVFVVATGLLFIANTVNAQQKLGHINSDEIFAAWEEAKTVQNTLDNLGKTKQAEIDKMINEYQTQLKAAQEKERTLSEANKEVVMKELQHAQTQLQDLAKRIEEARTKAGNDLQNKQAELLNPLRQKVENAIKTVAKEKGFAYVFDVSSQLGGSVTYSEGGEDITEFVKTKLGIGTAKPAATGTKKH